MSAGIDHPVLKMAGQRKEKDMNKIKGNVNVTLTVEEVMYVNDLLERDIPMPMGKYYFASERFKDEPPVDACGACGDTLVRGANFCAKCGRRVDKENYKLEGGE